MIVFLAICSILMIAGLTVHVQPTPVGLAMAGELELRGNGCVKNIDTED